MREPSTLPIRALLLATSLVLLLLLSFADALDNNEAYGHAISRGITGPPVRIDNEQFSDNKISTDGVIKITGSVVNISEQKFELSPYIFVTKGELVDSGVTYGQISPFVTISTPSTRLTGTLPTGTLG